MGQSPWRIGVAYCVALGAVLRLVRYAANYPLWGDEAFVAVNFIARGYRDLLRPLDYGQICPPLFLWVEHTVVEGLGFSEWSLRLFPLACSLASLFLFLRAAGLLCRGAPALLAVAIFAVSFHPLRHAAEVKPYASDLTTALVLLVPTFEWLRRPGRAGWLWALAAIVPVALAMSHPAVFVAGGISLGIAPAVVRSGSGRARAAFSVYNAALIAAFLGLYFTFTEAQNQVSLTGLRAYWAESFPPIDHPARLPRWLWLVHTGTMFAYPGGGRDGYSLSTFLAFLVGAGVLLRRGRKAHLGVCLWPFALTLLAAALRRYPYGGEARQMQFVAPSICLISGLGLAEILAHLPGERLRARAVGIVAVILSLGAIPSLISDVVHPYRFASDRQVRDLARRSWPALARGGEVACLRWDFLVAEPGPADLKSARYLCNQMIYGRRRPPGTGPRWDQITVERPLRCVLPDHIRPENPAFQFWLGVMHSRYNLLGVRRIGTGEPGPGDGPTQEHLRIYEFVPRPALLAGRDAAGSVER